MNSADAIVRTLESPNVSDCNGENANVVDVLNYLANSAGRIAKSITPLGDAAGRDATGGTVGSLTEAVMGITAGLVQVASAIESLADAVSSRAERIGEQP